MSLSIPPVIPEPFANQAGAGYINTIQDTTAVSGAASWQKGFPSVTMEPESAGGVAPAGQDLNGVLNALSAHDYFVQGGQLYPYNAVVETAIGGYPVGSILAASNGSGFWYRYDASVTPSNPDTGGAGWAALYTYGTATITAQSSDITLNATQAAAPVLIINGSPVNNLNVIYPDGMSFPQRVIVNNATGTFSITAKTASGTGTVISPGGNSNPTGIWCDGTNIYTSFIPPFALNISVGASGGSLVQRDANGYIYGVYLNQSSGIENPAIGAIFVQNAAKDGFLRKVSPANFISQLGLAPIANPVFRGTPQAPTANKGTNTTQIATTAFVQTALTTVEPLSQTSSGIGQKIALTGPGSSGADSVTLPSGGVWEWDGLVVNINGTSPQSMRPSGSYAVAGVSNGGTTISYVASDGGATRLYVWAKRIA